MMLCCIALLGAGCGGFSGSHSVSPATFLLPGLGLGQVEEEKVPASGSEDGMGVYEPVDAPIKG